MAEVIRLDEHAAKRVEAPDTPDNGSAKTRRGAKSARTEPVDPTARIAPRSAGRAPRRPVIPSPAELASAGNGAAGNGAPTLLPLQASPIAGADPAATPHRQPAPAVRFAEFGSPAEPDEWDRRVASLLAFLRRRLTGEYEVDEFGFDPDLTDHVLIPVLRLLYQHWFRVEVSGIENIPTDGSALLVANHSGTIALDALMLTVAVRDEHPAQRRVRTLGADLVFRLPLVNEFARKSGATLACTPDVERLLTSGELVAVFPEGFKGVGKPFSERYKLQRFGRGGFVSAAMRTRAPIVPVSIVGAEETYPLIGDIKPLARLLGAPYFPVTPLFPWLGPLGLIPLPSKWLIHFGEPIDTTDLEDDADDPMVVFNLGDQVRETIQQTLYNVLLRRTSIFG